MKALTIALFAAIALPIAVHYSSEVRLKQGRLELAEETRHVEALAMENRSLNQASQEPTDPFSAEDATELAKLRNEISQSLSKLRETNGLAREVARLHAALANIALEAEDHSPTALLADEIPIRLQRVKALRQWLEENPDEKIPELALLSEDSWIRSADRQLITDEEMQGWMVAERANAQVKFADIAFKALQEFAAANKDHFPADLSDLLPYFKVPADPAMLDRYEIVPASSLPKFLRGTDGDWLITQKAPINERDARIAIGRKGREATFDEGRWNRPSE
jgi:hypothetical protein